MSKEYKNRNRRSIGTSTNGISDGSPIPSNEAWMSEEVTEGPGNIRVSISVGHSEDYGRNKFSVTVDHGLSCGQRPEDKKKAYEEAKAFCLTNVQSLRTEVLSTLFNEKRTDK